ncbi:alpha/beta hydrolase family protein [Brevundimonas subvibrioides]|uniref:alpha/beta hydrolase family protein n=1 Tax=Brevundimonas subvibrioides TaxID=74313 RepID=UPI0022B39B87|nr:prolyl oligopeptidase family serine peptidase [Brevundimonas subvibrioides]
MLKLPAAILSIALMSTTALAQTATGSGNTTAAPAATGAAGLPTIEQMAAFPRIASFSISPDGQHVAALQGDGENRSILIWQADHLDVAPTVINASRMKIRDVSFLKNDVLGVSLFQPFDLNQGGNLIKTFVSKFYLTDLQGRSWYDPMELLNARSEGEADFARLQSPALLDALENDPDDVLVTIGADVYRLDVHRRRGERIQRSGERVIGYQTDLQGALRVRNIADRDGEGLYIATQFRNADGGWDEHLRNHIRERDVFSVVGFAPDPNIAYVISNRGRDRAAIFEYNVASRTLGEVAFEHPLFEATGMWIDRTEGPTFGEIMSFSYAGPRTTEYPIAPDYASLYEGLEQALQITETPLRVTDPADGRQRTIAYPQGRYMRIEAASQDLNLAIVWTGSANDPGAYYLLRNKTDLTLLSRPYPDVRPETLGTTSLEYFKARDGLDIPVFVTRPSEAIYGSGPWPTVILPHGGPWSRDDMDFDGSWWPQLLTSRGYAVIQPQFRGSDGWGRRLWTAGDAEWGQKMQDDLDDSVLWATAQGVAAPDRVAMFGFSYGGYAAMVAGIRPNGLYQCAIAGAGVSDLSRIRSSLFQNPYTREAQRDTVDGLSPVTRAREIQIPMMVFHGDRDQTVQLEQSELFVRGANNSGQPVAYHVLTDYAHGPAWTRETAAEQLGLLESYLRTDCGPGGL